MSDTTKPKMQKVAPYAWVILIVVYIDSFIAPLAQFKVTTLSSWLMPAFGLDLSTFGWLMSALTVCGVLLAFPAAYICRSLGMKKVLLMSAVSIAVGGIMSVLATSVVPLMVGRVFEGIGIGLVGVAGPTAISVWFPSERRGLPLGIWGTWMPLGTIVMLLIAPPIAEAFDFRMVFWICIIAAVVAFFLILFFYKEPPANLYGEDLDAKNEEPLSIKAGLKTLKGRDIWFLGIAFFFFSAVCNGAWMTYYPTFLQEDWAFTPAAAGAVTSLLALIAVIGVPIVGTISDMLKRRKIIVLVSYLLVGGGLLFGWQNESLTLIWVFVGISGIGGAMTSAATRPMVPAIMEKDGTLGIAMGMSVMQIAQNLGPTILAPMFGAAVATMGWNTANLTLLVPAMVLAIIALLFVRTK